LDTFIVLLEQGCGRKMSNGLLRKGTGIGVSLSLVLLVFSVLVPSASAVALSAGIPDSSSVIAGTNVSFQDVSLTIRADEAIPVQYLTFCIFKSGNHHKVAHVRFYINGTEIFETPFGSFSVVCMTNTKNLPYQSGGHYYGYDERTGQYVRRFRHGYGYGYGYGAHDLTITYTITYTTCIPGTYYAKLFVKTQKHTYISEESTRFTVVPQPPLAVYLDIKPGYWPNTIKTKDHGYLLVAICGTETFDVRKINPKTLRLSFDGENHAIKTPFWKYKDVATPWEGADGGGHSAGQDSYLDLTLTFRVEQVIHALKLFKHPGQSLRITITGSLKKTEGCVSVSGYDYVQVLTTGKK